MTTRGWLIAEGPHLVEEAARSGLRIMCAIIAAGAELPPHVHAHRTIEVPEQVYRTISGTATPQGMLALAEPPQHAWPPRKAGAIVIVLDGIQDPGNAGTIARSAEAFGAAGLIFLGHTANPMNPKTLRASAGSLFRIPFVRQAGSLDAGSAAVFAGVADPSAPAAWDCNLTQACAIAIGNEGSGVSAGVLQRAQPVRIPTSGVESLNAAVAASVLLYEAARQRRGSLG